jgi:hypothetical protein
MAAPRAVDTCRRSKTAALREEGAWSRCSHGEARSHARRIDTVDTTILSSCRAAQPTDQRAPRGSKTISPIRVAIGDMVSKALISQFCPDCARTSWSNQGGASRSREAAWPGLARTLDTGLQVMSFGPLRSAVLALFVTFVGASSATAWCVRGVEGWDTLRIRTSPSPYAQEIGGIPANACGVAIIGSCRGTWCPVVWRGRNGWSNRTFPISRAVLRSSR